MGNIKTGNPWILDTAEEVVAKGTIVRIKMIKFVGTGDESAFILDDGDGKVVWAAKLGDVTVAGYQDKTYFGDRGFAANGLTVDTIDNGMAYVYLADEK